MRGIGFLLSCIHLITLLNFNLFYLIVLTSFFTFFSV